MPMHPLLAPGQLVLRRWDSCPSLLQTQPRGVWSRTAKSSSRVRLSVNIQYVLGVDVGVALGGGEAGVPQQLLDGPEVGATLEQVGRERMAQGVGAHLLVQGEGEQA